MNETEVKVSGGARMTSENRLVHTGPTWATLEETRELPLSQGEAGDWNPLVEVREQTP